MRKGAWWTSSAEIICACTWYRRHPAAASPLVREKERGFHRWLDSNPPRRAVSLINLSSAMRVCSHRCVSSFIWREQPEKDHGSYAFRGCQGPGEEAARASVRRWGAVPPPHCPHKSPCGACYLHAAHEAVEAGGCPVCLCQAKLSITSIFQSLFDRLYCWMLHSNEAPTAFCFTSCKDGF